MFEKRPLCLELPIISKLLVLVLATSVLLTDSDKEVVRMSCIYYPVQFQKKNIKALLNSGNKINTISFAYVKRLGLKTWKTNVKAQKIDNSILETFEIIIADFQVENKVSKPKFFQKTFLSS